MRRNDLLVCWFDANQVKQAPQKGNGIKNLHLSKVKNKMVIKPRSVKERKNIDIQRVRSTKKKGKVKF